MRLYGVEKPLNYEYSETVMFREAYLDFYSKSLKACMTLRREDEKYPVVFSKRLIVEQKMHNEMLKTIMADDPAKHARTSNLEKILTEGGNGLADISLDPMLTLETELPAAQKQLLQEETKHLTLAGNLDF